MFLSHLGRVCDQGSVCFGGKAGISPVLEGVKWSVSEASLLGREGLNEAPP